MKFFILLALVSGNAMSAPLTLHVATNGNDNASGAWTRRAGDGPLATIQAALRKARAARTDDGVVILVHGGLHRLAEPMVFTPEDSGASAEKPFTIAAFGREKPVLSGGARLTHWTQLRSNLWQADARAQLGTNWQFRSLFINGRRATRARTPDEAELLRMNGARFNDKPFQFKFHPGDIQPAWAGAGDVELVAFEKWTDIRQFIRNVNTVSNVVTLSGHSIVHTREAGARYFIENAPEAVDAPGEWRLDRNTGLVTAMFKAGEAPNGFEITLPSFSPTTSFCSIRGSCWAARGRTTNSSSTAISTGTRARALIRPRSTSAAPPWHNGKRAATTRIPSSSIRSSWMRPRATSVSNPARRRRTWGSNQSI